MEIAIIIHSGSMIHQNKRLTKNYCLINKQPTQSYDEPGQFNADLSNFFLSIDSYLTNAILISSL